MKKMIAAVSIAILFSTNSAFAINKTFIKEYTYMASDLDSKVSSRAIALEQVKRALLEELGTYLVSETEVKDFRLTKDQITTLTAGIVSAEIIDEKWDGRSYYLKAKISADPDQVAKSVDSLRNDVKKTRELEDARKKADDAMQEVERLKKELALAKADTHQQSEYIHAVNKLSASEWLDKANKFFNEYAYQDAVDAFGKAMELDPKNVYAYHGRGDAYSILGNHQQAIADFTRAIELDPKDVSGYTSRADAYQELGDYEQAAANYSKAIELDPKDPNSIGSRAFAYQQLGKHQRAIDDYAKMIALNPKDWSSYKFRGENYERLGKYRQAIDDYTKAIELLPENGDFFSLYITRGDAFRDFGKYQQAVDDYTKIIALHPKKEFWSALAYSSRALVFREHLHDYKRAIDDYTKIIALYPKEKGLCEAAYADRGALYNNLDDYEHAIADFTKEIELNPKAAYAYRARGIVYEKWHKTEQANADYQMAARLGDKMVQEVLKERGITW